MYSPDFLRDTLRNEKSAPNTKSRQARTANALVGALVRKLFRTGKEGEADGKDDRCAGVWHREG